MRTSADISSVIDDWLSSATLLSNARPGAGFFAFTAAIAWWS